MSQYCLDKEKLIEGGVLLQPRRQVMTAQRPPPRAQTKRSNLRSWTPRSREEHLPIRPGCTPEF